MTQATSTGLEPKLPNGVLPSITLASPRNTVATNCRLTGNRIDYAGNGNMADDTGTTFTTGNAETAPEID